MILLEPELTPYDLRWRMFGIDVRVHPMFWLFTAVLGWSWFRVGGLPYVLLWVGCVFVSILVHELGHVLVGRFFGSRGSIVLFSFGGLAIGSSNLPYRWQRVLVYLAGPGAQFLILGLLYLLWWPILRGVVGTNFAEMIQITLFMLWNINLFWPLLNLMPIWPLDGGQVTRELCEGASPTNGRRNSLLISMIAAILVLAQILMASNGRTLVPGLEWIGGGTITAIFFGLFAFQSYQLLQEENGRRRNWQDDRLPWER